MDNEKPLNCDVCGNEMEVVKDPLFALYWVHHKQGVGSCEKEKNREPVDSEEKAIHYWNRKVRFGQN
jgi:hypothetical protein